jgi:hypothetical protein
MAQRDKTYADLVNEEKQAAASGDATQIAKRLDGIQEAAAAFPGDGRFQKLLDDARKTTGDFAQRDKTYADLTADGFLAVAMGDLTKMENSLRDMQMATKQFPTDRRFKNLFDDTLKSAGDQTYAILAGDERWAANGDAAQLRTNQDKIQRAADDFPGDARFQRLLDDARKITSDFAQRDQTYVDLADAEKQAAASGDWAQFKKSVQSIEKAAGDYPGDSRFQLLARRAASDLEEYTAAAAMPPQDIIDYLRQKNERLIKNISPTSEINSVEDYLYIDEPLPSPPPQKRLPINSHHKRSKR